MRERIVVQGKVIEDTPKSVAGERVIALDEGTVSALKAHRKQQLEDRLTWGEAWVGSGKVFVARTAPRCIRTTCPTTFKTC